MINPSRPLNGPQVPSPLDSRSPGRGQQFQGLAGVHSLAAQKQGAAVRPEDMLQKADRRLDASGSGVRSQSRNGPAPEAGQAPSAAGAALQSSWPSCSRDPGAGHEGGAARPAVAADDRRLRSRPQQGGQQTSRCVGRFPGEPPLRRDCRSTGIPIPRRCRRSRGRGDAGRAGRDRTGRPTRSSRLRGSEPCRILPAPPGRSSGVADATGRASVWALTGLGLVLLLGAGKRDPGPCIRRGTPKSRFARWRCCRS